MSNKEVFMSIENVIYQAAPTLANIKTGNLFPVSYNSRESLNKEIIEFNLKFMDKGICLLPVRYNDNKKVLLYLYRPKRLCQDLSNKESKEVLKSLGYKKVDNIASCLGQLIYRLNNNKVFPHEIGLFLSYPIEDVKGFIDNHAKNYKFADYWVVYGDENQAKQLFASYHQCTDNLYNRFKNGELFENLLVCE